MLLSNRIIGKFMLNWSTTGEILIVFSVRRNEDDKVIKTPTGILYRMP